VKWFPIFFTPFVSFLECSFLTFFKTNSYLEVLVKHLRWDVNTGKPTAIARVRVVPTDGVFFVGRPEKKEVKLNRFVYNFDYFTRTNKSLTQSLFNLDEAAEVRETARNLI
jgi:hypothetical protein